jgi:hypothetical protein
MDLQPLSACPVDRAATLPGVLFQLAVLAGSAAGLALLSRRVEHLGRRLGVMALGVLIFELFTAPMWHNAHLGRWAYLYRDVSWVLTLGWSVLFLLVVELGDRLLPRWRAWRRFLLNLVLLPLLVVPLEWLVVRLGIKLPASRPILEVLLALVLRLKVAKRRRRRAATGRQPGL